METLRILGCKQHNLQAISLEIPKQKLVAIVGVSGSGKSSLVFDTIHAEGQRRYLECLSPSTRQWMKQLPKPQVERMEGLSPTLAITQGLVKIHPRATIATYTDLYDFLALLYANCGQQFSPDSGKRLRCYSRQGIIHAMLTDFPAGSRLQILSPVQRGEESLEETISRLQRQGFIRLRLGDAEFSPDAPPPSLQADTPLLVVIDRVVSGPDARERIAGSVETALDLGRGRLIIQEGKDGPTHHYSEVYVCPETGRSFPPLQSRDFNFNSAHGACPACEGRGGAEQVHPQALRTFLAEDLDERLSELLDRFPKSEREIHQDLWRMLRERNEEPSLEEAIIGSERLLDVCLSIEGDTQKVRTHWKGLIALINAALQKRQGQLRFSSYPFVQWQPCTECGGARLKQEALFCRVQGIGIHEFCAWDVNTALKQLRSWTFAGSQQAVADDLIPQIAQRLEFLQKVGLGYLELNRLGTTLSQGEAQRVQLAAQLGAKLSGVLYILDEPSLGLHPHDVRPLAELIEQLRSDGNTVLLVEHNPSLIRTCEHVIELGPGAGVEGGRVTFEGAVSDLIKSSQSVTGPWLKQGSPAEISLNRSGTSPVTLGPIRRHNLQDLSVSIPMQALVGICGVSGSGKSTLLEVLKELPLPEEIERIVEVNQAAAGLSSRSIPATYIGIMTALRRLFSETRLSQARGYGPARFSLNKRGGRCEGCEGQGRVRVSMQLLPDIFVTCEQCNGERFNEETLQITWKNHSIAEVLSLSAADALQLFQNVQEISRPLQCMVDLGLGYLTLGQPFTSLSGGERQRLRLVADLAKKTTTPTLYVLDEPCSGLHFEDVHKLGLILQRLVEDGHSVVFVEHHLHLLRFADWILELGPGGGPEGGRLIFEGLISQLVEADTPTGKAL